MFVNSLFKDYLVENGLDTWKDKSTRDIICLEFNYGSRTYRQELDHLYKVALSSRKEYVRALSRRDSYAIQKAKDKCNKITELLEIARKNKFKYCGLAKEELRTKFYNEGVNVEYIFRKHNGEIRKRETLHYKMLYRSTGKAKKGSCMFIIDKLYDKAINFLHMGIKIPEKNAPIVELSAYAPLISSGIVGKVRINPRNILVLKDVERFFKTNIISIETDDEKHCTANHIDNYQLKNTLFDGQALIDSSIFPEWGHGYILLRHHFTKMAAFNTNIQKFFKDYFGDGYSSAIVKDMWGNEHYVKDIELITTDNAIKWNKFSVPYEYWCDWVEKNDCQFGIVKTAHESKLGNVQKMSYQMVNSLNEEIMENVVKESVEYVERLKTDNDFFLEYLKKNSNFSNDFEVLIALCEHNKEFYRSSYFRERKKKIIETYVLNVKTGKIIQNADNLTVVGSPFAMLLYAATGTEDSVDNDTTFYHEDGTIQCYTRRFDNNEHLAFFRSPFNSKNNLLYLHNHYDDRLEKYFNFSNNIIAINMIGTDAQDRANGMDMDSDFGYTTNQIDIVEHARKCYVDYPTIVNNIPKESNHYNNTMDDYALVDNLLSKSQTDIGESSNLAQIAQTYASSFPQETRYDDYVSILSVLAQVAIDSSKRRFDTDVAVEIKKIKDNMNIEKNKYPIFWKLLKKNINKENINDKLTCPMNYIYNLNISKHRNKTSTLPMSEFFISHPLEKDKKQCKKVEELISNYSLGMLDYHIDNNIYDYSSHLLLRSDFDELLDNISKTYISTNYSGLMSWLINRAFKITPKLVEKTTKIKSKTSKNKPLLMKILYQVSPRSFLNCFKEK